MWKQLLVLIFAPVIANGQGARFMMEINKGISFTEGLTWSQLKEKAKVESKFIFVDCYATWCGPCKMMDRNVYPLKNVGDSVNAHFIAVKVQMDTTEQDDEMVKSWYADARLIKTSYKIAAFPSFLFFSPEGELVHRDVGYKDEKEFLSLVADAVNPTKRYIKLLKEYQQGRKDYELMPHLVKSAKLFGEDSLSENIAKDYKKNYLDKLSEAELSKKEYFDFIVGYLYLLSTKDNFFKLCYYKPKVIDKFMYSGFSRSIVNSIVTKEEIDAKLWINNKPAIDSPNWDALFATIASKYDTSIARRTILDSKLQWYNYHKDWSQVVKYNIEEIETYGLDTVGLAKSFLNNMIFDVIFMHSNDTTALNKGIRWMEIILETSPDSHTRLDTYANLLYKVGRKERAIQIEQQALALAEKSKDESNVILYKLIIDKMNKGIPTWED